MQINSTGFIKATLDNYLEYMTSVIQTEGTFGSDFTIKKEGVIDAILSTVSNACISLEDKFAFALKQLNPYTAEGQYQDKLYALIGLTRNYATNTVVTRTIEGTVGTEIGVNELVFETSQGDQFYLNTAVTIGETGKVVGSFTAYEAGSIACDEQNNLNIVEAPIGILGVYYSEGDETVIGDDFEDDTEFRARWIETNSVKGGNTEGGMYAALLPLANNSTKNLVIRQNRNTQTFLEFPKHTMHITIKSAESNETIANTIFDNLMDGVGLYGDISVTVKDISGTDEIIQFSREVSTPVYFNVEIVLKQGYILPQVRDSIKKAIIDNFNYAMGEKVIANDFYQYINAIEGIDYVTTLEVSLDGEDYYQTVDMEYNEFPTVIADNISIAED
jgi:hypothetical protein